jgi:CRISPR-associated protein Csb3
VDVIALELQVLRQANLDASLLDHKCALRIGKTGKLSQPLSLDPRNFVHALDLGFSANESKLKAMAYPIVEVMALVGLQRCLPVRSDQFNVYHTWQHPLGLCAASAVACGVSKAPTSEAFAFKMVLRSGQGSKSFDFASKFTGETYG